MNPDDALLPKIAKLWEKTKEKKVETPPESRTSAGGWRCESLLLEPLA